MTNKQKQDFIYWFELKRLSTSTIAKYSNQAHNRIFKELKISFYELKVLTDLQDLLIKVKRLEKQMPNDPKRMYSSAVSNYIKYKIHSETPDNHHQDLDYLIDVEETLARTTSLPTHIVTPRDSTELISGTTNQFSRNKRVGAHAIQLANYTCQIDSNHRLFISRKTKKNYVEAHHLIPIAYQAMFEHSIDTIENIVSLCSSCHRMVHFGLDTSRIELLEQLYNRFKNQLRLVGTPIKFKDLLELYGIDQTLY